MSSIGSVGRGQSAVDTDAIAHQPRGASVRQQSLAISYLRHHVPWLGESTMDAATLPPGPPSTTYVSDPALSFAENLIRSMQAAVYKGTPTLPLTRSGLKRLQSKVTRLIKRVQSSNLAPGDDRILDLVERMKTAGIWNAQGTAGQRPLSNVTNMNPPSTQPRSTGRAQPSKPTIWGQPGLQTQSNTSARDASIPEGSWAQQAQQALGTRTTPLDFSSSSFPSLNNGGGGPAQTTTPSSAWQGGPPQQSEPPPRRGQQIGGSRTLGSRQPPPGSTADFFPADRSAATMTNGPPGLPGLAPRQSALNDSTDLSRVTSPAGMPQDSRSPIGQHLNGTIGGDRPHADPSPASAQQPSRDPFAPSTHTSTFEAAPTSTTADQTPAALLSTLSEKDKWGMKGYLALAEGSSLTYRSLLRGQDLSALGLNMSQTDSPLLSSYTGPFAIPTLHHQPPLRPLDSEFHTPECYTVKKVAPLSSRINCFSDETLFYMFYSMPRDYIQILVAQELMERKWRYHVHEQMWMMRDEGTTVAAGAGGAQPSTGGGQYTTLENGLSEQGYYIWWDKGLWKKVRRAYTLRYADLDDMPNVGAVQAQAALAQQQQGLGRGGVRNTSGGMNGTLPQTQANNGPANGIPGLDTPTATSATASTAARGF
ncbi:General negative regulator of transcription subunit 2 [Cyphellophora attinorum]|uniref:General negative regulator of transcription subunit 2 n=1 Tax=Cyphellophora attinorum TaxID=1664694 RepID=A0A0N1P0M7_9EURO|nr:General negative regulator of transcription subunit 2 [Phialophora attinorum]KPI42496.1 General negative regulator of transcription subunit 2 [Phialophora attinorum]